MISRKEALNAGLKQYTTGKTCKYGHMSPRYTQSGTCVQCVLDAARQNSVIIRASVRERNDDDRQRRADAVKAAKNERTEALTSLVQIKLAIHVEDIKTIFDTAIALCQADFPCLDVADVRPSMQPIKGTPVYKVNVPINRIEFMRTLAGTLWSNHGIDIAAVRQDILARLERMAEDEADEPPEGRM